MSNDQNCAYRAVGGVVSGSARDYLDEWQFWIFKAVLFVLFCAAAYRLLDAELRIGRLIQRLVSAWRRNR